MHINDHHLELHSVGYVFLRKIKVNLRLTVFIIKLISILKHQRILEVFGVLASEIL